MSDVDPTPDTPVTIGDRMAWWRGDMVAHLLSIRNGEVNSLAQIAQRVAALRGEPASDLAQLRAELSEIQGDLSNLRGDVAALRGGDNRNLSQIYSALYDGLFIQGESVNYPAHIRLNAELEDISDRIDALQAGVGAMPYESLELASVRGLLHAMLQNMSASTYGLAPVGRADDVSSDGDAYIEGRVYALFGSAPLGVTVAPNGYQLSNGNWDGWMCYIQTADPEPWQVTTVHPANRWYELVGSGSLHWSVDPRYTIRVSLRPPVSAGFLDFVSSFVTLNSPSSPRPAVVWGTSTPYQTTNLSGSSFVWSENVGLIGNFRNAIISCKADSPNFFRIVTYNGSSTATTNSVAKGSQYILNRDTTLLVIDNHTVRDLQFTGRIVFP